MTDVAAAPPDVIATTEPAPAAPLGNPATIGVPTFIVGSIALGMVLIGFVPASAVGASIPIILAATGIGQLVAAVWALSLAQNAVASVFGIFAGFWLSYAALVLGLTHNWYGVGTDSAVATQEVFLTSWLVVIIMLTLATLRLPFAFTLLFVLVDLALVLVLIATAQGSSTIQTVAGWVVFAFAAVGAYLFFDAMSSSTGGSPLPLGRPVIS
ncbi:GPR1/FUN34/YaaH family transporter [Gordonia sp. DT30]|uniref:GPR1/FUN34/YaaH family transporter n=1 Tax=unclassified Gordonia (in: high G+C Gram-positive bacteria) TaxID=2657482 RepID=UPI003CF48E22